MKTLLDEKRKKERKTQEEGRKDRQKWFCDSQIFDERSTKGRESASRRKDRNERQKVVIKTLQLCKEN